MRPTGLERTPGGTRVRAWVLSVSEPVIMIVGVQGARARWFGFPAQVMIAVEVGGELLATVIADGSLFVFEPLAAMA
jgi:hypothetical protein